MLTGVAFPEPRVPPDWLRVALAGMLTRGREGPTLEMLVLEGSTVLLLVPACHCREDVPPSMEPAVRVPPSRMTEAAEPQALRRSATVREPPDIWRVPPPPAAAALPLMNMLPWTLAEP